MVIKQTLKTIFIIILIIVLLLIGRSVYKCYKYVTDVDKNADNKHRVEGILPDIAIPKSATIKYDEPLIFTMPFLSQAECKDIIHSAKGKFKQSSVSGEPNINYSADRTSSSATLSDSHTVMKIKQKVSDLCNIPMNHIEPLQVVRYTCNQFYKPHLDYFNPTEPTVKKYGQRVLTLFVYLNEDAPQAGTHFPALDITIFPKTGKALVFNNTTAGKTDSRTLHQGLSVQSNYQIKYGMNIWVRSKPYGDH